MFLSTIIDIILFFCRNCDKTNFWETKNEFFWLFELNCTKNVKFQFYEVSLIQHKIMNYCFFFVLENSNESWDHILTKFEKILLVLVNRQTKNFRKKFSFFEIFPQLKFFYGPQKIFGWSNFYFDAKSSFSECFKRHLIPQSCL